MSYSVFNKASNKPTRPQRRKAVALNADRQTIGQTSAPNDIKLEPLENNKTRISQINERDLDLASFHLPKTANPKFELTTKASNTFGAPNVAHGEPPIAPPLTRRNLNFLLKLKLMQD